MSFFSRKIGKQENLAAHTESDQVPTLHIKREPMPLSFRDVDENELFEIGGALFIRLEDGAAYCFYVPHRSYFKKGRHEVAETRHIRLVTRLHATVEGSELTES